jgi:hypothetical protein
MAAGTGSGLLDLLLNKTPEVATESSDPKKWNEQYQRLYHKHEYTLDEISGNDKRKNKHSTVTLDISHEYRIS